jgi:hypothetical protein
MPVRADSQLLVSVNCPNKDLIGSLLLLSSPFCKHFLILGASERTPSRCLKFLVLYSVPDEWAGRTTKKVTLFYAGSRRIVHKMTIPLLFCPNLAHQLWIALHINLFFFASQKARRRSVQRQAPAPASDAQAPEGVCHVPDALHRPRPVQQERPHGRPGRQRRHGPCLCGADHRAAAGDCSISAGRRDGEGRFTPLARVFLQHGGLWLTQMFSCGARSFAGLVKGLGPPGLRSLVVADFWQARAHGFCKSWSRFSAGL